ncbi:MAG: hypothetical protein RI957_968 [Verrucomicrobiota bacterium]|jgi:parallel beta-helix repeat protein
MDAEEARRVLGLSSDGDWVQLESSFQTTRELMAELVRSAPTDLMAQSFQNELMDFDRAMAFYREKNAALPEPVGSADVLSDVCGSTMVAQGSSASGLFWKSLAALTCMAVGGLLARNEWRWRQEEERQKRIAAWESEAADHVMKRRWQEAMTIYQKIETQEPKNEISLIGRRSIEAGMLEEQEQYIAYWAGEAIAAFDGGRWDETLAAIGKVRVMQPRHEEMSALAEKVRFMQTAGIRQQWKDQAQSLIDQRDWDQALVWVEKILREEPLYEQARQWRVMAEEGRKIDEANRRRAEDLYQQVLRGDQGRYDPRLLEMIREAKKLAPADSRVVALYDKIAGYTRTIRVPEDFPQLQAAFDAALPQDRIVMAAGEYAGPFFLHVPVVLEASASGVVFTCPAEAAPALSLGPKADGSQIKGVRFQHSSIHADAERYSAVLVAGAKASFESCRFSRAAGHGLAVTQGADVVVDQCRFEENGWNGISLQDRGTRATVRQCQMIANIHHGIEVWNQATALIENNRCSENCLNGILIDTTAAVNLSGNQLTANRDYGIFLRDAGGGSSEGNRMVDNLLGGMVVRKSASAMSCKRNVFSKNHGPALSLGVGLEAVGYLENEFSEAVEKSILRDLPVE